MGSPCRYGTVNKRTKTLKSMFNDKYSPRDTEHCSDDLLCRNGQLNKFSGHLHAASEELRDVKLSVVFSDPFFMLMLFLISIFGFCVVNLGHYRYVIKFPDFFLDLL